MRFLPLLILLLPVASAGIGEHVNVLPPPAEECGGTYHDQSNTTTYWYGSWRRTVYTQTHDETWSCERHADTVEGNVTANEHEVASARVSDVSSDTHELHVERYAVLEQSSSPNSSDEDRYYYDYTSFEHEDSSWSGREAVLATELATLSVVDGCGSSSSTHASQYRNGAYRRREGNDTGNDTNETTIAWSDYRSVSENGASEDRCVEAATLSSGVTTVSGGREDRCASGSARNADHSASQGGWGSFQQSSEWRSSSTSCSNGAFVTAGSERVDVGSRSRCESHGDDWYQRYNNDTWGYDQETDRCTTQTGVFGPTGFSVYLEQFQQHESTYDYATGESTESNTELTGVGYSQNYVGRNVMYLA